MQLKTKKVKLNKLIYPIVVLSLIVLLSLAATYSWLNNTKKATLASSADKYITIDADAGLEMNYGDEAMNQGKIDINKVVKEGFVFHECTSYDGRTIFFPLSEYNRVDKDADGDFATEKEDSPAAQTIDFLYRPATAKDKNTKYISIDLSLTTKSDVDIYLSHDTRFKLTQDDTESEIAKAIRIAFIENEPNGKTVVFDNGIQAIREEYRPVAAIDSNGRPTSVSPITANAISDYNFGRNALFKLKAGVEKKITINIWLEGTDVNCTDEIANIEGNLLDVYIKFTTTSEEMNTYYFVDHTLEKWIDHEECVVFAIDENGTKQTMRKSDTYETDHKWIVEFAGNLKPVQFARYNPKLYENTPQEWNVFEAGDPGSCKTFNAYAHNTGIWDDNFSGTTISFYDAMLDHPTVSQTDKAFMYVKYDVVDGNGNTLNVEHKMSHPENYRWNIVIPSSVTHNITFNWYKLMEDEKTPDFNTRWLYWENTVRGNYTSFNAFDYSAGIWKDDLTQITFYDFTPNMDPLEQRYENATKVNVQYTTKDANGKNVTLQYTMSFQDNHHRWTADIPSDVSTISFFWGDSSETTFNTDTAYLYWLDTDRGNNTYYYATDYDGSGHWNNKLLYLNGSATDIESGVIWVAYFFNSEGYCGWVSMTETDGNGKYIAPAPDWEYVIFCRYDSRETIYRFDWDKCHNQTDDLTIGSNTEYQTNGYNGDRMHGEWK